MDILDFRGIAPIGQRSMYACCHDAVLKRGSPVQLITRGSSLLAEMFRNYRQLPFELLAIEVTEEDWCLTLEKRTQPPQEKLLSIAKYRCPGHVAEIMMNLRLLSRGEQMRIVAFGDALDARGLCRQVLQRGFSVLQLLFIDRQFMNVVVAREPILGELLS